MNRAYQTCRRGAVLIWALVLVAVSTTLLGGLAAYYTQSGRLARFYRDGTEARFAGQRILDEEVTRRVQDVLDKLQTEGNLAGNVSGSSADRLQSVTAALSTLDGQEIEKDGFVAKLTVTGQDDLADDLAQKGRATVEITAVVTSASNGGGLPVGATLRQTIEFSTEVSETLTTLPVFDYVYFANNNGRLKSSCVVANGDVGSNGNFDLSKATVNGFVRVGGVLNLGSDTDEAKIWPRRTYMAKVAANCDGAFTQVRPTDPIYGKSGGEAYEVKWPGGYDPAVAKNPYSFKEDPPTPVEDPRPAPAVVNPPGTLADPPQYVAPTGLKAYPDRNDSKYRHIDHGTGSYKYPDPPYKFGIWYYRDRDGSLRSATEKKKADLFDRYERDKKWLDDRCDAENARRDALYNSDWAAVDSYNRNLEAQALATYQQKSNTYWTVTVPAHESQSSAYLEYLGKKQAFDGKWTAYTNYLARVEDYEELERNFWIQYNGWETDFAAGTLVDKLTRATYGESSVTNFIIREHIEPLEWPQELSDAGTCQQYCRDYRMTVVDADGKAVLGADGKPQKVAGTLSCDNAVGEEKTPISFTVAYTNMNYYKYSGEKWITTIKPFWGKRGVVFKEYRSAIPSFTRKLNRVNFTGGGTEAAGFVPISDSNAREVSGSALAGMHTAEKGSVVLVGTQHSPITINGPVYIPGDVIIRGLVTGRGTIYAGRNIHVVGDISYMNPPDWPHGTEDLSDSRYTPDNVKRRNAKRDLLSLVALGNVIVGDYSSGIWTNATQMAYLRKAENVRDYTTADGGTTYRFKYVQLKPDSENRADWDVPDATGIYHYYISYYGYQLEQTGRRLYESVFGDDTISHLKQFSPTAAGGGGSSGGGGWNFKEWLYGKLRIDPDGDYPLANGASTPLPDVGDVTEIDSILIANYGIFGVVGGTTRHNFTLNGSMICRDEGLLTSFDDRFRDYGDGRLWLNWDMRMKSNSAEGVYMGLVEKAEEVPGNLIEMHVTDWRQVK